MEREDIPNAITGLFLFANLGCVPGEPNPQRYKSYLHRQTDNEETTNEHIPILKRPPIELTSPETKFRGIPLSGYAKKIVPGNAFTFVVKGGYRVSVTNDKLVYYGKKEFYPSLEEFKNFFEETLSRPEGAKRYQIDVLDKQLVDVAPNDCSWAYLKRAKVFSETGEIVHPCMVCDKRLGFDNKTACKNDVHGVLQSDWDTVRTILFRIIQESSGESVYPGLLKHFNWVKSLPSKWLSRHILSLHIRANILDFWDNYRLLHPLLRQCPCCGAFGLIAKRKKRGRAQEYCSRECEVRFNQEDRETQRKRKKIYAKCRENIAKKEIIKWLVLNYHELNSEGAYRMIGRDRAIEIYSDLPGKAKASLREFLRIFAKPRGFLGR